MVVSLINCEEFELIKHVKWDSQPIWDFNVDAIGNYYILGTFNGPSIDLGGTILEDTTFVNCDLPELKERSVKEKGRIYIAKFNDQGELEWAFVPYEFTTDSRPVFDVSLDGNVYYSVTCTPSDMSFSLIHGEYAYSNTVFAGIISSEGKKVWCRELKSKEKDILDDIVSDQAGNFYLSGSIVDAFTEENRFQHPKHLAAGFIDKYDVQGNLLWHRALHADKEVGAVDLALNSDGECFATVFYLGNKLYLDKKVLFRDKEFNQAVLKLKINGKIAWAKQFGIVYPKGHGKANNPITNRNSYGYSACKVVAASKDSCFIFGEFKLLPSDEFFTKTLMSTNTPIANLIAVSKNKLIKYSASPNPNMYRVLDVVTDSNNLPVYIYNTNNIYMPDFPQVHVRGGLDGQGYHYYSKQETPEEKDADFRVKHNMGLMSIKPDSDVYNIEYPRNTLSTGNSFPPMFAISKDNTLYLAIMYYRYVENTKQNQPSTENYYVFAKSRFKLSF
jgi:hypothetical protein